MAHHQTAGTIVVERLQIGAGAVVFGLVQIGIEADAVGQAPVDGTAVLQRVTHLTRRQPEDYPWMQQVVDRGACRRIATVLLIPVAQQFAFLAGEQVVAPALLNVAPVGRFVDQLLSGRGDLAVFYQAHFHIVDAAGQWAGIEGLQSGGHRLGVEQQTIAINLHRRLAIGGDIDRINAGFGAVDCQAVGTAIHHAHGGVGAGAERTGLAGQAFGIGGEVAQAEKTALQFALGVELVYGVISLVIRPAETRQLHVEGLAPVAQAAAGLQAITSAQVLTLAAVEIELVAYHQAAAAAFGLVVETLGLSVALGIFGDDRQQ
ncbi:hypothetical protein D3C86_1210810 [compost metagenome]